MGQLRGFHPYEDGSSSGSNSNGVILRKIDLAFLQHGLHDQGWWSQQPHGKRLYDTVLKNWRENICIPAASGSNDSSNSNEQSQGDNNSGSKDKGRRKLQNESN